MGYFEKIYRSDLSHRARAVYMYLRDHADSEGKCWPGIRTISAELRLSRSTVKRALDDLCRVELISKEHRWRENGSLSSNLYRLGWATGEPTRRTHSKEFLAQRKRQHYKAVVAFC